MGNLLFRRLTHLWTRSVANRLTVFSLLVFLVAALLLGLVVTRLLRQDMEQVLAAEQLSAARIATQMLDREVQLRLDSLDQLAALAGQRVKDGPYAMQAVLDGAPAVRRLFNGGGYITNAQGTAIAAWPSGSGREGVNYSDRDYVKAAQASGRPAVGLPVIGRTLGRPVIGMAAPIRDARGAQAGVLAGIVLLNEAEFLDDFHGHAFGNDGEYLIVEPVTRTVLSATDKTRVMEKLPAPGKVANMDTLMGDFSGALYTTNRKGVPVLGTVQTVPSTGWKVVLTAPTESVFRPAQELEKRLLASIALLALALTVATWVLIRVQLRPLTRAATRLATIGQDVRAGLQPHGLEEHRQDEVGQVINAFSELLAEINRRQTALSHSELLYSTAFQLSPDPVSITSLPGGRYLQVNESFTRLFGWKPEDIVGRTSTAMGIWRRLEDRQLMVDMLARNGRIDNLEAELVTRDGRVLAVQISASTMELNGERCLLAITHDITASRQAQRQIETLAFSDPLTGLPNRRLLTDRLGQALAGARRSGEHTALLFIDLDDFKQLNDSQGHAAGDKLLRAVAVELRSALRLSDTVARLGGDEFVVLIKDLAADRSEAMAQAQGIAQQVREAVARGAARLGASYHASVSIGIALAGQERMDGQELMRHADLAMYRAKAQGRGQSAVFTQDMLDTLSTRAELEADLRSALGTEQLSLHYQPQVGTEGRILGAEALVRWTRPGFGPVSPAAFIPIAEDSGLILPLGHWILETACRQLALWAQDPATEHLILAVNMSSRQFQQADFVAAVQQVLAQTGANPLRLRLELTETVLIDSFDSVAARMGALKALGVGFSLDDFGTGFSSLGYLKRLPLDELKIDAAFVREIETDANDQAIAKMIVALGQTLGLQVIAEGVETQAQRARLAEIGCHHYQGYLFGRPQPAADFLAQVLAQAPQPLRA